MLLGNLLASSLLVGTGKECLSQHFCDLLPVEATFLCQRYRVRESLDRSSDQEIPAQLNYVGRARIFSEVKDSLADRSQDGLNPLFGRLLTREANPQPSCRSGFRSSEDRGSKVSHFVSCVLFRQLPRCHWRNRAH